MNTNLTPSMIVWTIYPIFTHDYLEDSKTTLTFADNKE